MAPTLYMTLASPPVRAVLMCAKELGLNLNLKEVNIPEGEHLKPEFLKINPVHTVPTLVDDDDDYTVWDSHIINGYLIDKFGRDESLYPTDLKERALVDLKLHFDNTYLLGRGLPIINGILYGGVTKVTDDQKKSLIEAYGFVEKFLQAGKWVAGDNFTIADYSFVSSITSLSLIVPVEASKFPKIAAWLKQVEKTSWYSANKAGLDGLKSKLSAALG